MNVRRHSAIELLASSSKIIKKKIKNNLKRTIILPNSGYKKNINLKQLGSEADSNRHFGHDKKRYHQM